MTHRAQAGAAVALVAAVAPAAPAAAAAPGIHAHRGGSSVAGKATPAENGLPALRANTRTQLRLAARRGVDALITDDPTAAGRRLR